MLNGCFIGAEGNKKSNGKLHTDQGQKIHLFCSSNICFFQISSIGYDSYHSTEEVPWEAGEQHIYFHLYLPPEDSKQEMCTTQLIGEVSNQMFSREFPNSKFHLNKILMQLEFSDLIIFFRLFAVYHIAEVV